ncbi:MAG: UbiA family prenyltransferase, partial [Sphingomonas sp.]
QVAPLPLLMFALIFLWTPPHSWALALLIRDDYAKGGVPMLPVVAGDRATRWQMLAYTMAMSAVALVPWALGYAGLAYGVVALVASAGFVALNLWVVIAAAPTPVEMRAERALFVYSIFYVLVLFAALVIDRWIA